jgi:zona occludens toxin (predicted ATPase)
VVIGFTGKPGSGKSLTVISDYLLPQLNAKRMVFCNVVGLDPMCIAARLGVTTSEVCRYLVRFELVFDDDEAKSSGVFKKELEDGSFYYANAEGFALLVEDVMSHSEAVFILDECHEYLSPLRYRELLPFQKYLSMARHYGHDLVLLTQHVTDIWEPLANRLHQTHVFERGALGFRTIYKEYGFAGNNIYSRPRFTRNRKDDKSIYSLYQSHREGAKEHLSYVSVWRNKKLVAMLLFGFFGMFFFLFNMVFGSGLFGWAEKPKAEVAEAPVNKYKELDNVVYVKYVVCGDYSCIATRPDGTAVNLPLDYESGKYPVKVRRFDVNKGNNVLSNALSGGLRPGVQNAPR